jgi:dephospho-CoA kinase
MDSDRRKCVFGLIGGIGSGKSAVAAEWARRGARVIVADQLGHQALRRPEIKMQLLQRWGPGICTQEGEIDRRKLGGIVFADPDERHALERLVFPFIERGMDAQIALARQDSAVRYIVLDAAILLEAGWGQRCDWIVYVHAPRSQRLQRVAATRGWNEQELRRRSAAQLCLTDKVTRSDFVIDNSGSLPELTRQLDRLLARPELSPIRC